MRGGQCYNGVAEKNKAEHGADVMSSSIPDREKAARALCRLEGHPENTKFEGKPMWQSYLPQVDAVLEAAIPNGWKLVPAKTGGDTLGNG